MRKMPCFGVKLPKDAPLKRLNQREGEGDGIAGCTNHDIFEPKKPSFEAWTCPDKRKTITNAKPKEGGAPTRQGLVDGPHRKEAFQKPSESMPAPGARTRQKIRYVL